MLGVLLIVASAHAGAIEDWETLQDNLLKQSLDGDVPGEIAGLEVLTQQSADDPLRAVALYWLGQARYAHGDVDGARSALKECARVADGDARQPCESVLGQIEVEGDAITKVPLRWTFDHDVGGFVHPWTFQEKGSISVAPGDGGDPYLQWSTDVVPGSVDELVVGFHAPSPAPRGVRLSVRSHGTDTRLHLLFTDIWGRVYAYAGNEVVPADKWTDLDVHFDQLQGLDRTEPALQTQQLDRLVVQDRAASGHAGQNVIDIDDFEVY